MSVPALRPPRTTPNLQLPIPGDASPADYVTDTGAICDRLDVAVSPILPRVTSLPANPSDGNEIAYQPPIAGHVYDANALAVWHLRYNAQRNLWEFLGGAPAVGADAAAINIQPTTGYYPPTLGPFPAGSYVASIATRWFSSVATTLSIALGVQLAGGTWSLLTQSGYPAQAQTANTATFLAQSDIAFSLSISTNVTFAAWAAAAANLSARNLAVRPIHINNP